MNDTKPLNWLVIGGGLAGRVHGNAITRIADGALAGIVSSKTSPISGTPSFASVEQALQSATIDAAIVATPNHTHAALVETLCAAGIPTLCEKPVGRNTQEASHMALRSQQLNVPLGVVLNQRFFPVNQWIRRLITETGLPVRSVAFKIALPKLSGWQADADQSGGGILRLLGVHYLDLLRWWLGEPKAMTADIHGLPVDDAASIELHFAQERIGQVTLTAQGDQHQPASCVIEADGARIELRGLEILASQGVGTPPVLAPAHADQWFGPGHEVLLAEATQSLIRGEGFPITLADALPSLQLVDDLYSLA